MVQEASGELIDLSKRTHAQRLAIAKRLLASGGADAAPTAQILKNPVPPTPIKGAEPVSGGGAGLADSVRASAKKVWRHLVSGDVLLVNRQPTLHKPGIMAHVAR
eukprot:5308584-Prymnesium_polylepis.1